MKLPNLWTYYNRSNMKVLNRFTSKEAVANRLADKARYTINKAVAKDDISKPKIVIKHCEFIINALNTNRLYTAQKARGNLLQNRAFPSDIRKLRKITGWSDYDIIEYYWGIDKFRELWDEYLKMSKEDLKYCVEVMSRDKNWDTRNYENKPNLV